MPPDSAGGAIRPADYVQQLLDRLSPRRGIEPHEVRCFLATPLLLRLRRQPAHLSALNLKADELVADHERLVSRR